MCHVDGTTVSMVHESFLATGEPRSVGFQRMRRLANELASSDDVTSNPDEFQNRQTDR